MIDIIRYNRLIKIRDNCIFSFREIKINLFWSLGLLSLGLILNIFDNLFLGIVSSILCGYVFSLFLSGKESVLIRSKQLKDKRTGKNEYFFLLLFMTFVIQAIFHLFTFVSIQLFVDGWMREKEAIWFTVLGISNILFGLIGAIGLCYNSFHFNKELKIIKNKNKLKRVQDKINIFKKTLIADLDGIDDIEFYKKIAKEEDDSGKTGLFLQELSIIEKEHLKKTGVLTKKEAMIKEREERKALAMAIPIEEEMSIENS